MTYMYILKRILEEEKWWIFIYFKPIFYGKPYKKEVKDWNPCSLSTLGDPIVQVSSYWFLRGVLVFEDSDIFHEKRDLWKMELMKKGLWYFRWKKDSDILDKRGLKRLYRKN